MPASLASTGCVLAMRATKTDTRTQARHVDSSLLVQLNLNRRRRTSQRACWALDRCEGQVSPSAPHPPSLSVAAAAAVPAAPNAPQEQQPPLSWPCPLPPCFVNRPLAAIHTHQLAYPLATHIQTGTEQQQQQGQARKASGAQSIRGALD